MKMIKFASFSARMLLLVSASPYSGSPQHDSILHFTQSTSSPSLAPTLFMPSLTKSIHLLLGLPLLNIQFKYTISSFESI